MDDYRSAPGPGQLGETLERLVRNLGAPPISVLTQLDDRWPDVVGPGLSASTRPVELIDGVLTIGCADAAMAAQIGWMEGQIINRFATVFGSVTKAGADGATVRRVVTRVDR